MNLEKSNDIVVVTGVSASGKDFLLENAKDQLSDRVQIYSFGALIHDDMRRRYPGIYDASDSLKTVALDDLRISSYNATEEILRSDGIKVVNGHVTYRRQESIVVDPNMNILLRPRDYIFIEADPEEIMRRRISNDRDRVIESTDTIYIQQEVERAAVFAIAKKIGARVVSLLNDENVRNNSTIIAKIINQK